MMLHRAIPFSILLLSLLGPRACSEELPAHALARVGSLRWSHPDAVTDLVFTPDGQRVVTACKDGVIRVWEHPSGKLLRELTGHKNEVLALALHPEGRLLASGGSDGTVRLWEPGSDKEVRRLLEGSEWVRSLRFTPDGKRLFAGTDGGQLHSWPTDTWRPDRAIERKGAFKSLDVSGPRLACNGGGEGASLSEIDDLLASRDFGEERVHRVRFAPDGKGLLTADEERQVVLWEVESGKPAHRFPKVKPSATFRHARATFAVSADGKHLALGGGPEVELWDLPRRKRIHTWPVHPGSGRVMAFSPEGDALAVGGLNGRVRVWDVATGKERAASSGHRGPITQVRFAPDGKTWASVAEDGSVRCGTEGKVHWHRELGRSPLLCVEFDPKGEMLYLGDAEGTVHVLAAGDGKTLRQWQAHRGEICDIHLSEGGDQLLTAGADRFLRLWHPSSGKELREGPRMETPIRQAAWLSGERMVVVTSRAEIRTVDPMGRGRIIPAHVGGGIAVAGSPDGRWIASAGREPLIHLWESASGKRRRLLPAEPGYPRSLAFSPDGKWLASGHPDGEARLWNIFTGQELGRLRGHRGPVVSLDFSPDGKHLLTGGRDSTVMVWNVAEAVRVTKEESITLAEKELDLLWGRLGRADAVPALEALQQLARAPKQTVPYLSERVHPLSEERIATLLQHLDSRRFRARQEATQRLEGMGSCILPQVEQALRQRPSLEMRRRLESLREAVSGPNPPASELRMLRAVEILEMIGDEPARAVVERLSKGMRTAEVTKQAKSALKRLTASGGR